MSIKKIFSNTFVHIFGRVVGMALVILNTRILADGLGADLFGKYSTPDIYLWVFASFLDFGLYLILVRRLSLSKTKEEEENTLGQFLGFRLVTASFAYFIAIVISRFTGYSDIVLRSIIILSVGHLFADLNQILSAKFQSDVELWKLVFGETIGRIIRLVLSYLGIKAGLGVDLLISMLVISDLATLLVSFIFISRKVKIIPRFKKSEWKDLMIETLPLGISMMFILAYTRVNSVALTIFSSGSEENVGIFNPAFRIVEFVGIIPQILMGVIFPQLSRASKLKVGKITISIAISFISIAAIGAAITQLISPQIIELLTGGGGEYVAKQTFEIFGREFQTVGSITVLKILIISTVFTFPVSVFNYALVSRGMQKLVTIPSAIGFLISIITSFTLIPQFSFVGAAISSVITNFAVFIISFFVTKKYFYDNTQI